MQPECTRRTPRLRSVLCGLLPPRCYFLAGRLSSNAADTECLSPPDFLIATMKGGRNGMSLDWTQRVLREGLRCFHSGAFFEARKHWESVGLAVQ